MTYVRVCYARVGAGGAGWAPLDEQLGLQRGYTSGCQYFMAYFCGRQLYQESLEHFHEVFRADGKERVSMRKAYEMVCEENRGLEQQRQQEIKEYLQEDKRVAVQEQITETMVVCIDATKVPTRANENVADDDNKSYECQYRDSKVATVSAVEQQKDADETAPADEEDKDDEVRLTNTSCVTGIEHADQFLPRIEVEMQRRSAQLATLTLRADALADQRRHAGGGGSRTATDQSADSEASDRLSVPVEEGMLLGSAPVDQVRQHARRAGPERTLTHLAALAAHSCDGRIRPGDSQLEIADRQLRSLGRPDAGVVEEQQEGTLAAALPRGVADGREPLITGLRRTATPFLKVCKEPEHALGGEIEDGQPVDRFA